ncbi:Nif3-like dinuclear metal center hexameric protein [Pseudidiomarina aestuarii]|uniref:GTP cyclohydrolase 1 type 2 homolog n=1 Tax=Pseudidiomarina aestuarii TaxID=624146 RepID=A0A2T4CNA8_9GAMM|nr:Nif3-like dinuclear metal center hexameric protein [Pseudidiomarina aestuarii]
MLERQQLNSYLADFFQVDSVQDYCPNGLQVEGRSAIQTIVTGVTASQALIEAAISRNADAILVHHGYFWKNERSEIVGMKKRRLQLLLQHDLNLFAYHLPLDIHPRVGNNIQLAEKLGVLEPRIVASANPQGVMMMGDVPGNHSSVTFAQHIESVLGRTLTCQIDRNDPIRTIAWCTGGGQGFIDSAADIGVDAYLTGEVSEQTVHSAREQGLAFFAAGHHATERYGIKALGEHLAERFELTHHFIDIDNPA